MSEQKKLLVIGAHPDDAEFHAGGLMLKWADAGHEVVILCLTDGSAGHQTMAPAELAMRRRREAAAAAQQLGAEIHIWDEPDGELVPSIRLRKALIGQIRDLAPDLIVTHRTADYHPDHRATAELVQDASYLLQVPNAVSEHAPLTYVPPILLAHDRFTHPRPFRPDWVIDTEPLLERIVALLDCHESQVYEWLPHTLDQAVPSVADRQAWLHTWYSARPAAVAKSCTNGAMQFAEAYEISEYGGRFDADDYFQHV
jgi:LmbE family N-acetylglucosaminyl deacetylase